MNKRLINTIAALIAALALVFNGGCAKSKQENAAAQPAAESGEAAEENSRIYDEPYLGIKLALPDSWYKGVYEDKSLLISSYEEGLEVSYLSVEGRRLLSELITSLENMPETATEYSEEQMGIIDKLYEQEFFVCMLLLEYPEQTDTAPIRESYTNAKKIGEAGDSVYTLLYNENPNMSSLTGEDATSFKAMYDAMFELEKDAEFTGHKEAEEVS